MRARVYSNGGTSTGGFTFNGGQMTGAVILAGNPSDPLEAAAKQYVDSSLVNLNASNLTSGILPSARLPAFSGDIVKPAGSSTINLTPIGITAGDYTKPTVDAKGRVTSGSTIIEADLPNLSWTKVTTGKPTTLSGYGITDALSSAGGTVSGFLTFNGSVTATMQAVTKQYVDVTLSSSFGIAIGDIIRKPYGVTPSGFLKCNGALVDKTTYNALYATINDRFSKQQLYTSGKPWQQQYNINETQTDNINNWLIENNLPNLIRNAQAIITKNRVYLIGGSNGQVALSTVYTASINSDGTLGTWSAGTSLPGALAASQVIVTKNRVYILGGINGTTYVSTVYTAPINVDGTLGIWDTGNNLPINVGFCQVVITYNRVYLLGGQTNSSVISNIYSAYINSDGTLSSWYSDGNLPITLAYSSLAVTKNRVYLLGGYDGSVFKSTIYSTTINADGTLGTWLTSGSLPQSLDLAGVYISKKNIYIVGYNTDNGPTSNVLFSYINADGTLGIWQTGTNLPGGLSHSQLICTKNRLYLLGGHSSTSATSIVYSAIISGGLNDYSNYYNEIYGGQYSVNYLMPGSGKPWQQQYQFNTIQSGDITDWVTTTSLPGTLSSSQPIVTKNRVYLLGGYNGSEWTNIVYTAVINSDGTLGAWSTGTALPITVADAQAIVTKNRVYLLGGQSSASIVSTIYTAPINADGTLGTWITSGSLPEGNSHSQTVITKNRVYLLGGYTGGSFNIGNTGAVYHAPINNDGIIGAWSVGTSLPITVRKSQAIVTKNRIYLLGGIGTDNIIISKIYSATINNDGYIGPWEYSGLLPDSISRSVSIVTKNRVYLLGGSNDFSANNCSPIVYSAPINSDGIIGSWFNTGFNLPSGLAHSQVIITKNRVYLLGGYNGTSNGSTVYMASILGGSNDYSSYYDGSISPSIIVDHSTTFALPDLSQSEKFDTVSYIKY